VKFNFVKLRKNCWEPTTWHSVSLCANDRLTRRKLYTEQHSRDIVIT